MTRVQELENARWENKAEAFHRVSGHLAPGKSVPPEMGMTEKEDRERRYLWVIFCAGFNAGKDEGRDFDR